MKKITLILLLTLSVCAVLHADTLEDTQFDQYVELTRNSASNPKGMTVAADRTYRIIYATMPLPVNKSDLTEAIRRQMKESMLAEMRKLPADCRTVRDLKITFVYSFITSDKYVVTSAISYKEL